MARTAARTAGPASTLSRLVASPFRAFSLLAFTFSLLVGGCGFWARHELERLVEAQVASQLTVTRDASVAALSLWLGGAQHTARRVTSDASVGASLAACLTSECDFGKVAERVRPYTASLGFRDILLADRLGNVRGADGARRQLRQLPEALVDALEGLPSTDSAVMPAVLDEGQPALWVGAPVSLGDTRGGVLLLELPLELLGATLNVARPGQSGETYAFDRQGRFLSQSRFLDQLKTAGLLSAASKSPVLVLDVRDPGVDITEGERATLPREAQPLTRMARDAVAGGSAVDVRGYRDYRGVTVVGAWRFLPEFGVGVASEVDHDEAFATTLALTRLFEGLLSILFLSCASSLAASFFIGRLRSRAARAQRLAERFGQYRIVRKLGEGGMGAVYLAHHELLRRPAVIKLVREDRMGPDALSRFETEARITSTLTHPNTVAVYDYGVTEAGLPYYVMEYVDGVDLERLVKHFGPMPEARVVHLLRQLCGSLAEAHAARLVHRDVKPANLVVCRRAGLADTLKVLDFGLARSLKPDRRGLTERWTLLGTPELMAPELFESGSSVSPQSDLYAVGCVAYYLLTGTNVFAGSEEDIGRAHLTRRPEPPSLRLRQPLDPDLETAVLACLAKARDARPPSAEALRELLERTKIAHAWTEARAAAWWCEHASRLALVRAEEEARERTPTLKRLVLPSGAPRARD